jgi:Transglycosylase SLT domain
MKRFLLLSAAALALLIASPTHCSAQESLEQNQLTRASARTEARARGVRLNFERLISQHPEFLQELRQVAERIETRPEWLLNVIASESSFIPSARNRLPRQTASGLLQIIEGTAAGLGTNTAAIRRMNAVEQLRLIEKYFTPFRGKLNSLGDVYLAVFRGFIMAGGLETVVAPLDGSRKERRTYHLNRGLDVDRNGRITKGELATTAFSAGRFGDMELVAQTRPRTVKPQQEAVLSSQAEPPRSRAMSLYIGVPASSKPAPMSSSKPTRSQAVIPKTRSTYFP